MSVDAELSVVGIMLMEPEGCGAAYAALRPAMFELEGLGTIFDCCARLRAAGRRPDAVTVLDKLGPGYKQLVVRAAETAPASSGLSSYITAVQDGWRERSILNRLEQLRLSGMDADGLTLELRRLLEEQERALRFQQGGAAKDFAQGLKEFLGWMARPDTSIPTGFGCLDRLTGGLVPKGVTAVSARPGCGKTSFALQMAAHIAKEHTVLYQSLEMPVEQVYTAILARALRLDSSLFRRRALTKEQAGQLRQVSQAMAGSFRLLVDDSDCASLGDLEAGIRRHRPRVLFVDHLGLVTPDKARPKRNDELAALTRGLKQLAMKYELAVVELVQASRNAQGKRITMADMFGSATIEHDADLLLALNPAEEEEGPGLLPVEVDVLKNRHGAVGSRPFYWNRPFHQFLEVTE